MCLEIKQRQGAKIAKEDIKCYKVLKYRDKEYFTFYRDWHVYPNLKCKSDIIINNDSFERIIEDALHSFTSWDHASIFFRNLISPCLIIECTIPKGARYYKGQFHRPNDSYASDVLIYPDKF